MKPLPITGNPVRQREGDDRRSKFKLTGYNGIETWWSPDSQVRWDFKYQMSGRLKRQGTQSTSHYWIMSLNAFVLRSVCDVRAFFSHDVIRFPFANCFTKRYTKYLNGDWNRTVCCVYKFHGNWFECLTAVASVELNSMCTTSDNQFGLHNWKLFVLGIAVSREGWCNCNGEIFRIDGNDCNLCFGRIEIQRVPPIGAFEIRN